jgi:UDP-glucose 4-epimerase
MFFHVLLCPAGIRDYIHVMDLAEGHVLALKKLEKEQVGFKVRLIPAVYIFQFCSTFSRNEQNNIQRL